MYVARKGDDHVKSAGFPYKRHPFQAISQGAGTRFGKRIEPNVLGWLLDCPLEQLDDPSRGYDIVAAHSATVLRAKISDGRSDDVREKLRQGKIGDGIGVIPQRLILRCSHQ